MKAEQWQKLLVLCARWNDVSTAFVCLFCICAAFYANVASRWTTEDILSRAAIFKSFTTAINVSGAAAIFEGVNLLCGRFNVRSASMGTETIMMLQIYLLLLLSYLLMRSSGDFMVHSDMLCYGGPRPVYTIRYLQWSLNVPLLMLVSGGAHTRTPPCHAAQNWMSSQSDGGVRQRTDNCGSSWSAVMRGVLASSENAVRVFGEMPLAASARLTIAYIFASWLALVVDDHLLRWLLISASFSAYFVATLEQVVLFFAYQKEGAVSWAGHLLLAQVFVFGIYGGVYLLAVLDLVSSTREQELYTFLDISAKMTHSVVLTASRGSADATEAAQLRNAAMTAAADLKRMIQEASVPIFVVNTRLEVEEWNHSIAELTGMKLDEVKGKQLTQLLAENEETTWQEIAVELLSGAIADTEIGFAQFQFPKQENDTPGVVIIAASASPIRGNNGAIRGAVCIGQDITDAVLQRQEAQALAAALTRLIDTACVPIFEVNQDMRITEWNSWMVKNLGLSKIRVLDAHLSSLLSPSSRVHFEDLQEELHEDRPDTLELTLQGLNSKQVTLRMGTAQRTDREKNVVGTIYIGQDVTELKDIDEWKISMMAMMSHELKSPLHGIIGLSHAMLLDKSTAQKGSVVMISNCAKRLLDVVRNLMDTSELLHRRNRPLARDPVHLAGVAEEVVLLCQQAVDKRGVSTMKPSVKIINTLVEPLPVIEADAYRCTQLLYSLVSNAIKFTHKGSVTISASADDVEEKVTVYVKDTGIGISSDNLDRIFEPFDQEDRSEKRGYEGLGMGLALCREIVHQHRGTLAVKSQKGKGSTFQFTLPYKMPVEDKADKGYEDDKSVSLRVPATQARQSTNISDLSGGWSNNSAPPAPAMGRAQTLDPLAAITSTSPGAEMDGPSKNLAGAQYLPDVGEDSQLVVLSVDDDMINQQVMTSLLQSSQYKLQVASNFGEALNYLLENPPPALILLEVMTPGLSGPDALRTLRKKYSAEVLPIIMISANGDKDTITRCLKLGANDFVKKPFHLSEMFARLELHCNFSCSFRRLASLQKSSRKSRGEVDEPVFEELEFQEAVRDPKESASAEENRRQAEVIRDLESKLERAEQELQKHQQGNTQLEGHLALAKEATASHFRRLEAEVKKREQLLLSFGPRRDEPPLPPSSLAGADIVKNINRLEESVLMKELGASKVIASLPEADAEVLRDALAGLREEALRQLQESSRKEQLLLDANFKLHWLGMSLKQKDMQLGLRNPKADMEPAPRRSDALS